MTALRLVDERGIDAVVVPPALAALIARPLRDALLGAARRDGLAGLPPVLLDLLGRLDAAARAHRAGTPGTTPDQPLGTPGTATHGGAGSLSTDAAAAALGCSARRIRALVASGALPATRTMRGAWRIDPVDLARHIEERTARCENT